MANKSSKQKLVQSQALIQSLSPQQVLLARLLELTTVEMEDRVRGEIIDNPAIESIAPDSVGHFEEQDAGETPDANSADDYRVEDDIPDYYGWDYHSRQTTAADIPTSADVSFGESLLEQLGELTLDENERRIGEYLIGSLEEDGLLYKSLEEIADELNIYNGMCVSEQELERILKMIQTFDPAGIGARSLQECLLLQIARSDDGEDRELQRRIIEDAYDDFSRRRWEFLPEKLNVDEEQCKAAIAEIVKLNPRPGASLSESLGQSRQQIIPDFVIDINGEYITISSAGSMLPELRVSSEYCNLLDEQAKSGSAESRSAAIFLKQKIESAKNFISAVKQREQTLARTIEAIVDFQREFLLGGGDESLLKPMILDDIARKSGYDISTVSRVSNNRYVQLPWGVYPLKYFFSDGVATADGGEKSVRELYKCLQELVDNEDKNSPLTDSELMDRLKEQGFTMARRTVAKYRESLHIPVARLRKE
ncbi:MAG: RNA polymerase factor sigma-54 [Bacteroidaceae bacterium]|nr:RNA polymerase factor sigma-54 [Bacteroidaceae bacterium]